MDRLSLFGLVCSRADADLLRAGESQPLVHPGVQRLLSAGIGVRIPARGLAVRVGRGDLVVGRTPALAGEWTGQARGHRAVETELFLRIAMATQSKRPPVSQLPPSMSGLSESEGEKGLGMEDRPPRHSGFLSQAPSAQHDGQSRHVRGGDRQRGHHRAAVPRRHGLLLQPADHLVAVVHRAVRQLRRGHGGRTRQGPGGHAAQGARRNDRQSPACQRADRTGAQLQAARQRHRGGLGGRVHSLRRRDHRGHRFGR